jgi:hypothetical protein
MAFDDARRSSFKDCSTGSSKDFPTRYYEIFHFIVFDLNEWTKRQGLVKTDEHAGKASCYPRRQPQVGLVMPTNRERRASYLSEQ